MMKTVLTWALLAVAPSSVVGQLRPRRVGTDAMGQQEAGDMGGGDFGAMGAGMGGLDANALAEGMKAMQGMFNGEGGGSDMLAKMMDPANNPMLKALGESNPELAAMLNDPEAMQQQMAQAMQMFQSEEGQEMMGKMMGQMQEVLTNPEKLKEGLQNLKNIPGLEGMADMVPGLQEVLDNPEQLEEQATKTAELFQKLSDPEQAQEMLAELAAGAGGEGGLGALQEALAGLDGGEGLLEAQQNLMKLLGGAAGGGGGDDEDVFGATGEESGADLKARVQQQLAAMMAKKRAGGAGLSEEDEVF